MDREMGKRVRQHSKVFVLKHKGKMMVFAALIVLLTVLVLLFDLIALVLSKPGAYAFVASVLLLLLRKVAVISTFPGCFKFYQRMLEVDQNRDYASTMNQASGKLLKFFQHDLEKGRVNSRQPSQSPSTEISSFVPQSNRVRRYRYSHQKMMQLVDSVFTLKSLVNQHVEIYKRMGECNTLKGGMLKFRGLLEDFKRIMKYRIFIHVEEIRRFKSSSQPTAFEAREEEGAEDPRDT
mmetsp:Transcript_14184/g.24107  ORF Transcript_14184/g.24107 Transcript_14184/m.24107 type:complete len:236 (-) Transcript_14184:890-1597(-)